MGLLTPLLLLLGFIAAPIIIMYMLRLRRKEVLVSSTMLWEKLLLDRQANAPWQRLRRNLLLLLQLLILAALVLALARPYLPVPSIVSGNVVVLLDGSASMLAADIEPNRFEEARNQARSLVGDLQGEDVMTLILVGQSPRVLASATSDRNELREALDSVEIQPQSADWEAAFALAAGAAQGFEESKIVVISDGGLSGSLPPLSHEVVYLPIGSGSGNLALSALAVRSIQDGAELLAQVAAYGSQDQEALLTIELDDRLFDSKRISAEAGEDSSFIWTIPEDARTIKARLTNQSDDHLSFDNEAWAINLGSPERRALLAGEGNRFLETALSLLPNLEVFRTDAPVPETAEASEAYDLYIFDSRPLPDPLPTGNLLLINPLPAGSTAAASSLNLQYGGIFSDTKAVQLADSPLLRHVDWSAVNIRQAASWSAPWLRPIASAEGGPLLLAGELEGRRIVLLNFRLQDSDLPLQVAFPVLTANIVDWLLPAGAAVSGSSISPGDTAAIAAGPSTTAVAVQKPDGSTWVQEVGQGPLIFDETEAMGIYDVAFRSDSGEQQVGQFAVNLFSPVESSIEPAAALRLGEATVETDTREAVGQRELWPFLAAAALLFLVVEWWLYQRRGMSIREAITRGISVKSQNG